LYKAPLKTDFFTFTAHPWLHELFAEKVFSFCNEHGMYLESRGKDLYIKQSVDKARGCFVGFAVGDALGYPVAGIALEDVPQFISYPLRGFRRNPKHPFFSKLLAGQYTGNTRLLLVSAEYLSKRTSFNLGEYAQILNRWGQDVMRTSTDQRWLGPTTVKALQKLANGVGPEQSGDNATTSCSALYRVIPFAVRYHEEFVAELDSLADIAQKVAMVTHASNVSKLGCAVVCITVVSLLNFSSPEASVRTALDWLRTQSQAATLYGRCLLALRSYRRMTIGRARREFGTGSDVLETLPLALFCFLKFADNFESGVLSAANSCRKDSPHERRRLAGYSWKEALVKCKGGNTDGVAAIAGSLLGCVLGLGAIPRKFRAVEDRHLIEAAARKVWWSGRTSISPRGFRVK
jgi:ADP-ribosylglycohydrolase